MIRWVYDLEGQVIAIHQLTPTCLHNQEFSTQIRARTYQIL
jgi:hypothetical protein